MRIYKRKGVEVVALQGLDLHVGRGDLVAIVGASGSGKSTLLNILSGLDSPSAGRAVVAGHDLLVDAPRRAAALPAADVRLRLAALQRQPGPYLTAGQNVDLPQRLAGTSGRSERSGPTQLLDQLGIAETADPSALASSPGGQQQRLAIAVSLANEPAGAVLRRAHRRPRHRRVTRRLHRPAAGQRAATPRRWSWSPTIPRSRARYAARSRSATAGPPRRPCDGRGSRGRAPRGRRGVRGPRPHRAAPAPPRLRRRPRPEATGQGRARRRPHPDLAGRGIYR